MIDDDWRTIKPLLAHGAPYEAQNSDRLSAYDRTILSGWMHLIVRQNEVRGG
jgi:hypothetical protein